MRRKFTAFAFAIALAASALAQDCPTLDGARKVESERYVLSYRTQPTKIVVGQHFSVDLAVCPKGSQVGPDNVRVDGFMPEHNHGMNYKAVVKASGTGRYNAAGLMFHMPGKWDFIFDIRGGGKTDRLKDSITLH
jgi:hypothetical protein